MFIACPRTKHIDFGFRVARIARRLRQTIDAELRAFGLTEATCGRWPMSGAGRRCAAEGNWHTALAIEGPSLVRLLDSLERRV